MKILVCDDDPVVINIILFKLQREGFGEVIVAADGREALAQIKINNIKLIITDLQMPFLSGLEIISFVRNNQRYKTPILVMSSEGLEDDVLKAFELGADDYMVKPFSLPELMVRVKRLLRK
ncbi:response regulator [Chryseotalea sanaruensis]|uniref:Response regulator n=1 Tax=Chryseotalea sanaruensis TaxID=2482724 RepID=A0A401UEE0_9BACT|nr:response regulator transcription factor [Chryseotalea sanaruensis]GCC53278.1 response regulator [Chryseotalea sanaruensis]